MLYTRRDPYGQTTKYAYDSAGKVISTTDPDDLQKLVTYLPAQHTTRVTALDGGVWTSRYDPRLGVLTHTTDPLGNTTIWTYNASKQLTKHTAPDGAVTLFTVDARGNRTSVKDALGQITTFAYNAFGQVLRQSGPPDAITIWRYDGRGNLLEHTDASGAVTHYTYDARGNLLTRTDALDHPTTFLYDAQDNLLTRTDATGAPTTFVSDSAGRLLSATDALGRPTQFAWSSRNELLQVTDARGLSTTFAYDLLGNRILQIDAADRRTEWTYNHRGQPTAVRDALGGVTKYTYGATGCAACGGGGDYALTQVTDAKEQSTAYAYDRAGRLLTATDALGNVVAHTYDATGRRLSTTDATDPIGAKIQYSYDALGRLRRKQFPDQTTADYTYDASNNLSTASNAHLGYTFRYDRSHRLTEVSDSRGLTLDYTYDALGRRTRLTYPDNTAVAYDYDAAHRLVALTHGPSAFAFTYDRVGRRTQAAFPNGTTATYAYNRTDDLLALTHKNATGTVLQRAAYVYNGVGNRTIKVDQFGTYDYTYDAGHRLQEANTPVPSQPLEAFTYDLLGNRLDSTENGVGLFNAANQLRDDADFTYQYDTRGNLRRQTATVGGETTQYFYDVERRLVRVVSSTGMTVRYLYDALGRRIKKVVTDGTTTVTQYVYDHEDIILERNGANQTTARYTHGPGIDEPLMVARGGQRYVYHTDGLGSITALTDAAGVVRQRYTYTSFGTIASQLDANFVQPYTFTGREFDVETGLYYYRARTYDATTGRFLQRDPIGFAGGDLNLYAYAGNNPVRYIDPNGLMKLPGDPSGLPPGWIHDPSHRDPNGERWRSPDGGDYLDFHRGRPGMPGWRGKNHWHHHGDKDHLPPGDEVPDLQSSACGDDCKQKVATVVIGTAGVYIIYRCARFIPSLFPLLWPTIPVNLVVP